MSQFCIDFEGMLLPDAIAAVVEAWYEAQIAEQSTDWVSELRLRIKRECGRGWIIDAVGKTKLNPSGKCRLSKIAADRTRASVVLPLDWLPENADKILGYAIHVKECINSGLGMNMKDALACRWRGLEGED